MIYRLCSSFLYGRKKNDLLGCSTPLQVSISINSHVCTIKRGLCSIYVVEAGNSFVHRWTLTFRLCTCPQFLCGRFLENFLHETECTRQRHPVVVVVVVKTPGACDAWKCSANPWKFSVQELDWTHGGDWFPPTFSMYTHRKKKRQKTNMLILSES